MINILDADYISQLDISNVADVARAIFLLTANFMI